MYPEKNVDNDATKGSHGESKDAADDDTTVKISPGGPPPRDTKGILKPAKWTLSPGQTLIVSVGKGLSLEMNSTGCVIKPKKK